MLEITKQGSRQLQNEESSLIYSNLMAGKDKNYHYLSLDCQLSGYSPLGGYICSLPESLSTFLYNQEKDIINSILERQEVCSLFKLGIPISIYPFRMLDSNPSAYELDIKNIDKHFQDILELNDKVYKADHLFLDLGNVAKNYHENRDLIRTKLQWLLMHSKCLNKIYILWEEQ